MDNSTNNNNPKKTEESQGSITTPEVSSTTSTTPEDWASEFNQHSSLGLIKKAIRKNWDIPTATKQNIILGIGIYVQNAIAKPDFDQKQIDTLLKVADTLTKMTNSDLNTIKMLQEAEKAEVPSVMEIRIVNETDP